MLPGSPESSRTRVVTNTSDVKYEPVPISLNGISVNLTIRGSKCTKLSGAQEDFTMERPLPECQRRGLLSPYNKGSFLFLSPLYTGTCPVCILCPLLHNAIPGTHLYDMLYWKYSSALSTNIFVVLNIQTQFLFLQKHSLFH